MGEYFRIESPKDLLEYKKIVENSQSADLPDARLINDIDMTGVDWEPIVMNKMYTIASAAMGAAVGAAAVYAATHDQRQMRKTMRKVTRGAEKALQNVEHMVEQYMLH